MADEKPATNSTRRQFLQRGAATTAGVALGSQVLGQPFGFSQARAASPLVFYLWDFQPNMVIANLGRFTKQYGVPVQPQVIPNVGYVAALSTKMLGGLNIDGFYNFKSASARFIKAGWAQPLDSFPHAHDVLNDIFPNLRTAYMDKDRFISMPYFNTAHVLFANTHMLAKQGLSVPKTKQDLYNACKKLKSSGVPTPYLAYWIRDFMEEYFNVYLLSEGIQIWDAKFNPTFADSKDTVKVFEWWQSMYQDHLTSPTMLTDQPPQLITGVSSGKGAFFELHTYFLQSIRTSGGSEAKNVQMLLWQPGKTGQTLEVGEVYQLGGHSSQPQQAWELLQYLGWKDKNGLTTTFNNWAKVAGLCAPYPAFFKDKTNIAAFASWGGKLSDVEYLLRNKALPVAARNQSWYQTFVTSCGNITQNLLVGKLTPQQTISQLASAAKAAQANG